MNEHSLTYATTFSGIGGWELGLNACGWRLQWQCESDPFCQAVLRKRFGAPIYNDIRTLADEQPPNVDVLIGSPPCQPFSEAGAQRGTTDERHLFPSFIRAAGVLKPRWILMEQVPGLLSIDGGRPFGQYIGGLVSLGYDLVWHCIPASAIGAMHKRDRVWIVAYSHSVGLSGCGKRNKKAAQQKTCLSSRLLALALAAGQEHLPKPYNVGVANGIPLRAHRTRAIGNSIVPQIALLLGQAINSVEGQ